MFKTQIYVDRRAKLKRHIGSGLILFIGNGLSPMNYQDNTYRFRQDSNFLYFFGLDIPQLAAVIDIDNDQECIFGKEINLEDIIWSGPQPTLSELASKAGVSKTALPDRLESFIENSSDRTVHYLPPYRPENKILLSQILKRPLKEIESGASATLIKGVVALRSVKIREEIQEMEKAIAITQKMHVEVMAQTRPGLTEAKLAGIAHGIAISAGGDLAYPIILSTDGHILHNHFHGNIIKEGQLILGDFGAESAMHYAADITRTFPVNRKFSSQQKEIYQIVLDALLACITAIKPGIAYRDIHIMAAGVITEGLKNLGIMRGNTEEAIESGAYALFMPHGIGHMIGLDVHDMEDLGEDYVGYTDEIKRSSLFGFRSLRFGRRLKPGFVLTVEPGLYFIPQLIEVWKEERKHEDFINYEQLDGWLEFSGVRIEDNVLVTSTGSRILGEPIAKNIKEIEEIRAIHE